MSSVFSTLLTPYGYSSGTCGYCSPSGERSKGKTSSKYGMITSQMTPEFYQLLINKGWRRSGDYIYHPDMARTCCPQYTIRLNTKTFKANKKHRQVINRFNRYLETGQKPGESSTSSITDPQGGKQSTSYEEKILKGKGKGKGKNNTNSIGIIDELHKFEIGYVAEEEEKELSHRFTTQLVPAKSTKETFELYKLYQIVIHKDKPEKITRTGFDRFLCGKTLIQTPINYKMKVDQEIQDGKLPKTYGQYHLLYKIDGILIGLSVIDILPCCVSSVYFIWHPDWAWASLGKFSALYEISLSERMREKGIEEMQWVYMGYWIPDCQKMKYKSEYSPSELLDPGTNTFHLLDIKLESFLIANPSGYFPFSGIISSSNSHTSLNDSTDLAKVKTKGYELSIDSGSESEDEAPSSWPVPTPPGFEDPSNISDEQLEQVILLMGRNKFTGQGGSLIPIIVRLFSFLFVLSIIDAT
uniref:Arginyl-tRNA--protein transferase 1 n=1 Tax=Kwoniella pini CBS 10737 TaxID=1296096 RepID=A0A1B9HVE3_9TREE|nr:uncharacterized protein I206_07020 [Kwoniella pini CBS 10737]OCF47242.1 hypothetical protein I206_07020 [Kwoniella pini CBS 10737]